MKVSSGNLHFFLSSIEFQTITIENSAIKSSNLEDF